MTKAPSNTRHWDVLGKTDPNHTSSFSRSGGFKGTAMRPIWIVKRMTEHFGPVGEAWGMERPTFEVIPLDDEVMVYCTVGVWHTTRENLFYGVGGDKVRHARRSGAFNSDEAFKMAYTDAVNNALKYIGVGADIHMGQFDDSKYVGKMRAEFAEPAAYIARLEQAREDIATATTKLELDEVLVTYADPIRDATEANDPLVKTVQSEWVKRMKAVNAQLEDA